MQSLKDIISEMEEVLDHLIENAERLHELSKQVILEDEVEALQKIQNDMLTRLTELDSKRASVASKEDIKNSIQSRIDKKIDLFQDLNDRFIDNLSASHGLIHFEGDQIKKPAKPKGKS